MFCPKCGSMLLPKKMNGKKVMGCCSCSFVDKDTENAKIVEKGEEEKKLDIVDQDEDKTLPETDAICPKCGNKKAHYWMIQTRAGDEPETKFLKCTACKYTWRDYS